MDRLPPQRWCIPAALLACGLLAFLLLDRPDSPVEDPGIYQIAWKVSGQEMDRTFSEVDVDLLLKSFLDNPFVHQETHKAVHDLRYWTYRKESHVAGRRLPQALIIGVKKGGTRALLEFMRLHPDVRAVGPETHFFDRHYDKGLDWYRRHMPPTLPGQITMEKTPSYFVTKDVPRRIYNMSREVKLLVVVRDPVTRAISDYTQTASKRPEIKSFEELAFLNNTSGLVDTTWSAVKIGVYAKHLQRWLQYFPLQQFHFISGELLVKDPAGQIGRVQDFLGLRRVVTENHFYFNETKGFPCLKKSERSGNPHCLGKTKGRVHPVVDNAVLQKLRSFYRPFNIKFYQLTGIDFGWN